MQLEVVPLKHRLVSRFQRYVLNPGVKLVAGYVPPWALLETIGRVSGNPRRTPVGNNMDGDTLWIVAENGDHCAYVRNVRANPQVRVRTGGHWRKGTATLLPEDDVGARLRGFRRSSSVAVRLAGTRLLTLRIDLDATSGSVESARVTAGEEPGGR